jgi:hypothetical protein
MTYRNHKPELIIILLFALTKLLISLVADFHSGFDGDEVLYIESGRHLAFGFMEAPPFISIMAFLQNLFHSQSIFVNHIFVHIASFTIIVLCGLIVLKLGGSRKALLIAMISIVFAPAFGITHNSFQPVIFDQLFWLLSFYFLISYCLNARDNDLIYLAVSAAFGFLSKYSIVFFVSGLFISVILLHRDLLKKSILWISVAIFLLLIAPNLYWQIANHFPVLDHFKELYRVMARETTLFNLRQFVLTLNPVSFPIWLTGMFFVPFIKRFRNIRLVTYTVLLSFILFLFAGGRFYYCFPLALIGLCIGSIYLIDILITKKWIFVSYLVVLSLTSVAFIPISLSVMDTSRYIKLLNLKEKDDGRIPLMFEARYTKEDWPALVKEVSNAYQCLSASEKSHCLVLATDYTQAGVINLLGKQYGLPEAFTFHGSFYTWVPEFERGITVIAIGNTHLAEEYVRWERSFGELFYDVELRSHLFCKYAREDRNACYNIFICRGFKLNSTEYKQMYKERIFE